MRKFLIALGLAVVLFVVAVFAFYRLYLYPYGYSHCCSTIIWFSLRHYAEENGGVFPKGGKTPEASLCLLLKASYGMNLQTLRGKTVSLKVAEAAMKKDGSLGPNSCGWHYVEGVTLQDDPGIAILWDEAPHGLGHNGQRLRDESRQVIFIGKSPEYVSASDWNEFLEHQKQLLAARTHQTANDH